MSGTGPLACLMVKVVKVSHVLNCPSLYIFWRKNSSDAFTHSLIAVNSEWYENACGDSSTQWREMVKCFTKGWDGGAREMAWQ